jgi:hypothetical protein
MVSSRRPAALVNPGLRDIESRVPKRSQQLGLAYLSPVFHEQSSLFSSSLLFLFCHTISVSPHLLRFCLNVLVDVLYAQELKDSWKQRASRHLQCFFLIANEHTRLLHACLKEKVCNHPVVVCMCLVTEEAETCREKRLQVSAA